MEGIIKYQKDGDTMLIKTEDGTAIARFGPNGSIVSINSANSPEGRAKQYDEWYQKQLIKTVKSLHEIADK